MLSIHPFFQFLAALLGLYVLSLGAVRFRVSHLKGKGVFKWKRHVILGGLTLTVWLAGLILGMLLVYVYWRGVLISGHGKLGLIMAPFIVFGLGSGLFMNRWKKKRTALPVLHGAVNLIVLALALIQVFTGYIFYSTYVLGR